MKDKLGILLFFIILTTACSLNYLPVETDNVIVTNEYGVIQTSDYTMAISYKFWDKEPQELSDYYTSFYISFKNNSAESIDLKMSDFHLLDSSNIQYDVIVRDDIMDLLMPEDIYFQQFTSQELQDNNVLENWKDARSNIQRYAFNFGKILPNSRKEGYLFFQKIPLNNQQCKIIYNSNEMIFIREK